MLEAHVRIKAQPFFNKLGTILLRYRFEANTITLISFITGAIAGISLAFHYSILALFLLWFSGLCDVMDGTIARLSGTTKKIGAYIDLISDRMVESAIILGFTFFAPQHYLSYIIFLIAVLFHFSTFVVAGAIFKNNGPKGMHYDQSLIERAEAFITFSLMMIYPHYIFQILMVFNALVIYTALTRFKRVLFYANNHE